MKFVKSIRPAAVGAAIGAAIAPKDLDINDPSSIRGVAKTIAAGAMSYYPGDADKFVDLPPPHYWWQAGALMGSMLDYSHYTGDRSYDGVIARALLEQVGPNFDYMRPSHFGQEGNDDQAFWSFSVLAAAERNSSQPDERVPSWLQLGANLWNSLVSRWNTSACGGGFDGVTGLGEQMCALETIQGLLARQSRPPLEGDEIEVVRTFADS